MSYQINNSPATGAGENEQENDSQENNSLNQGNISN